MVTLTLDYIINVLVNEFGRTAEQAEPEAELLHSMTLAPNPQDGMMLLSRRDLIEYIRYYL